MPTDDELTQELGLSDEDFRTNYIDKNKKWFEIYGEQHKRTHGGILCANSECRKELTPETMRPNGGVNYCSVHFKDRAMKDMQHYFSLDCPPTPNLVQRFEWYMRVARVMDGGLVKMAETDDVDDEHQKFIRERAKRHMEAYKALNPGVKHRPLNNDRIGGPPRRRY